MTTEEPQPKHSPADARPLASYETSFWAFLEYRSVQVADYIFMSWMLGALIFLMVRG
jgi:hypothetical protein